MCGIAGVVRAGDGGGLEAAVRRMIALQRHRGPDGEGYYVSPYAALGHCRLAILDVTPAGHQPMPDVERRYWLTFNGEIYNYLELAEELRRRGHQFKGRSDTEVLLAAYREWGPECLTRLRGMFAFAVWDERDRRLFAARDRLGIKPFHYWVNNDGTEFAFASELKALLDFVPDCTVNERLAREFLAWNLLDHEPAETMVREIRRLPAGHCLTWDRDKGPRLHRYWTLTVNADLARTPSRERERLTAEFRNQFRESIALHLRSDVPVGSCLSGGLDSSSIVCAVSNELRSQGAWRPSWQHTFSACFDDPRLDERPYIRAVTKATESQNHQIFPTGERLAEEMDTWLWHQEEPVGGSGVYAQYCVARLARQHGIKVLLDGQGADEQLAGYRKFILVFIGELARSGHRVRAAREATAFLSSWEILRTSRLAAGRRYLRRALPETSLLWEGRVPPDRPVDLRLDRTLGQRLQSDLLTFSLPLLLRYEDRNTMAFGVESRVPFVDHVLVEWISRLPADLRLSAGWTKRILRESLTELLPPMVRTRKSKLGFSTPESKWLRGPLQPWLIETLRRPRHLESIVSPNAIGQLVDTYRLQGSSTRTDALLFRLAVYETWANLFLARRATAPRWEAAVH
jgi:asparagine synthase (glutamine-hydrolysing)